MSENSNKIGVRVQITQETDEASHLLYEIFNVREFFVNNNTNKERMKKIKEIARSIVEEF